MINAIGAVHQDMRWDKRPDAWTNVRIEAAKRRRKLDPDNDAQQLPHRDGEERGCFA